MPDPTSLVDLATPRLGGAVLAASDEFFAPKENLLKPEPPELVVNRYTGRGEWTDGWETRRRRTAGHDWCVVQLGLAGTIRSVVVDTTFFRGNYPSHCSIDACGLPHGADPLSPSVTWHPVVPRSELSGNTQNVFGVADPRRFTHVRLNIFPDGGVARLRVLGDPVPDWTQVLGDGHIDLAGVMHGAHVVESSDRFFGDARNMLMPYPGADPGDGWITKRRRGLGHDWTIVRLGAEGTIARVEVSTRHFTGNFPESCSVEGAVVAAIGGVSADVATHAAQKWSEVLPRTPLEPDAPHVFEISPGVTATHVRISIFPDGAVSRFRVWGVPTRRGREQALIHLVNASDEPSLRAMLARLCASPDWVEHMALARPFASGVAFVKASDAAPDAAAARPRLEALLA